jgi:phosphoadenosine phosphosulfate reductase
MRIKEFEPLALQNNPSGYYVCISGGKDSSVIQELCIMAGVKCEFAHSHTSVDHPETVYFVRKEQKRLQEMGYSLQIQYPRNADGKQKTMWSGIIKKGLPTRKARWCCSELKENGGLGRYIVTGVRWAESAKRRQRGLHEELARSKDERLVLNNDNDMLRRLMESCIPKRQFVLNPIIDWSDEDIWEFVKERNLPMNPLYGMGHKRVGCIGCPMASAQAKLGQYPKYKNMYYRAVVKHFEYRKMRGLPCCGIMASPETYFDWWLKL